MKLKILLSIDELAQEFSEMPYFEADQKGCKLIFDYETESGDYEINFIQFIDVVDYWFTAYGNFDVEFIKSYNNLSRILDSEYIKEKEMEPEYKHFVIYFDGFGLYEVVAKSYSYTPSTR